MNSTNTGLSYRLQLWFLRRFSTFRVIEKESERLAGLVAKHKEAEQLSAAIIRSYKQDEAKLLKQTESDACLIESLNRYVAMLEGKIGMLSETARKLRQKIKTLHSRKKRGGQNR
jgi:hypothetical protein